MPPAAKHFDPLVGIDVHIVQPPGPVPPVPVPHPYTGMLMDPCDYAPYIGGTVKVGGLQRAQAGTGGISIPKHIPIGGVFVKPPADESEMFMGSSTVAADGDAFSYLGLPALSCQDIGIPPFPRKKGSSPKSLVLPTTVCLAIPMPVSVGGSPTVSLMALGMKAGMAALGALAKKVKKARAAKKAKAKGANGGKCIGGDPVDIVTGAVYDDVVDAKAAPPRLFEWTRHYSTANARVGGVLGFGTRHGYDHVLRLDAQAFVYDPPKGSQVFFAPPLAVGDESRSVGLVLRRLDARRYELQDRDRPRLVFEITSKRKVARLAMVRGHLRSIELVYEQERLVRLREYGAEGTVDVVLRHDAQGRIVEIVRSTDVGPRRLAAYAYDRRGDLVASMDAEGGERRYGYDDAHRWISRRDPCGFVYTWQYDALGRCVLADSQDGLWRTRFEYDPEARENRVIERAGGVWIYRYDENLTLRERIDPYGGVLLREVDDEDGRVLREMDAGGRVIRWMYDGEGGHIGRSDRFGHVFPPEVDLPNLPDPLAHRLPETPRAWWLGERGEPGSGTRHVAACSVIPTAVTDACPELLAPRIRRAPRVEHDELGRIVCEIDTAGRRREWKRDRAGNVVARIDADGATERTRIISWNLPGATIDPLGHETRRSFTSTEMLAELVDPNGNASRYEYDEKDRLVRVHRHGVVREEYRYDLGDRLIEKRNGEGDVLLELEYGEHELVMLRKLASGEIHRFDYDRRGALVEASTDRHEIRLATRPDGGRVHDLRDGAGVAHVWVDGRLRRSEVLARFVTRYRTDRGTTTIVDPAGNSHRVHRGGDGLVVREHPAGRYEASRWNLDGRCEARVAWSRDTGDRGPDSVLRWSYSREGDVLESFDAARGRTRWSVDAAHRLVGEDGPDGCFEIHHDAAGNVVEKAGLVGVVLDEGNRLRFANGESFVYDRRNHIAERIAIDGSRVGYVYDSLDRLVRVEDGHDDGPWTASYDAIGRRIDCGRGGSRTQFWWDGDRLAAELSPDRRLRIHVYASDDALVPIAFVDYDDVDADPASGRSYAVYVDHLGMPLRIENARGLVVWRAARVDPYGSVRVDPSSSIEYHLRWPGHRFDADTGLHYNRHRYYDPTLGRYLQSDPIGQSGGTNLYAYAANPLVHVDLLGLHAKPDPSAKPPDGKSPNAETPVKRGEVGSYEDLKAREKVGDNLEHDHIPSKGAVRDKINAERAARGEPPLTKAETNKLYDNLTAAEVDADVHKAGNTYGGKNTEAKRAADGANLEQAAKNDLDAHGPGLKDKGMSDQEIADMNKGVHDRNKEIGVYDDPLPSSLWE